MALTAFTGSCPHSTPAQEWLGSSVSYSIYSFLSPDDPAAQLGAGKISFPGDSIKSLATPFEAAAMKGFRMSSNTLPCCNSGSTPGTTWRRGQRRSDGSISLRRREQNRRAQSRFRAKRRASRGQAADKSQSPKAKEPRPSKSKARSVDTPPPTATPAVDVPPLSSSAPAQVVDFSRRASSFEPAPLCVPEQPTVPTPQSAPLSSSWPILSPPTPAVELASVPFMSPLCPNMPIQSSYSQGTLATAMPNLPSFHGPLSSPPLNCGMAPPPLPPAPGAPRLDSTPPASSASTKNHFTVDMLYSGPWFPRQWQGTSH